MPEVGLRVVLHVSVASDELALARITAGELLADDRRAHGMGAV